MAERIVMKFGKEIDYILGKEIGYIYFVVRNNLEGGQIGYKLYAINDIHAGGAAGWS